MNARAENTDTEAPQTPEELYEELAAGAALGALDPKDLSLWETARKGRESDPLPAALAQTAAALAWTVPLKNPPARCRDAVLEAVARRIVPAALPAGRAGFSFDAILPWAAAAIFAFASTFMAGGLARQKQEIARLRAEMFGPLEVSKALLTPSDPASSAVARLVFCAHVQQGRLVVQDIDPCPRGKAYQLWIVPKDSDTPVPVALFRVDESRTAAVDFKPDASLPPMERAMISIEDAGGARTPSGPVLLAGK